MTQISLTYCRSYYQSLVLSLCASQKADEVGLSEWKPHAQAAERQSALQVVELFQIYRSNYGSTHMSSFVIRPIRQAIHSLSQQDDKLTFRLELDDLSDFSDAVRIRFPNMAAVLKVSQNLARVPSRPLPPSIRALVA